MPQPYKDNPVTQEYEERAKNLLKGELKRRGLSYRELAEKLAAVGVQETERNLNNKISRGVLSGFLIAMFGRYWLGYSFVALLIAAALSYGLYWLVDDYRKEQASERQHAAEYQPESGDQKLYDPCLRASGSLIVSIASFERPKLSARISAPHMTSKPNRTWRLGRTPCFGFR